MEKLNDYNYINNDGQHLHTLRGQPLIGTSSVADVLKKDGLTYWASGLAVAVFGSTDGKVLTKIKNNKATPEEKEAMEKSAQQVLSTLKEMSLDDYIAMLGKAYGAHAVRLKDTAQAGTDMHQLLEDYIVASIKNNNGVPLPLEDYNTTDHKALGIFAVWANENVKKFLYSEVHCYSEILWVGGISDTAADLKNGERAIIDFKSSKEAYKNQSWQVAGYDIELSENGGFDKDGNKIFTLDKPITQHIIFPFGAENPTAVVFKDVEANKRAFRSMVELYKQMYID